MGANIDKLIAEGISDSPIFDGDLLHQELIQDPGDRIAFFKPRVQRNKSLFASVGMNLYNNHFTWSYRERR